MENFSVRRVRHLYMTRLITNIEMSLFIRSTLSFERFKVLVLLMNCPFTDPECRGEFPEEQSIPFMVRDR